MFASQTRNYYICRGDPVWSPAFCHSEECRRHDVGISFIKVWEIATGSDGFPRASDASMRGSIIALAMTVGATIGRPSLPCGEVSRRPRRRGVTIGGRAEPSPRVRRRGTLP